MESLFRTPMPCTVLDRRPRDAIEHERGTTRSGGDWHTRCLEVNTDGRIHPEVYPERGSSRRAPIALLPSDGAGRSRPCLFALGSTPSWAGSRSGMMERC